jgi:hypothetical protein
MDAELKAKWIGALRSGEYKQGRGKFEHEDKYCCLGVLCVVGGIKPIDGDGIGNWSFTIDAIGNSGDPHVLASMNDEGKSFTEIADYIEANL